MEYISRAIERKFLSMSAAFKAVMVVGARQIGKSTMLRHLAENEQRTYVTMDDSRARELAESDPALFFQMYKPPILIDEAQKAPALFEYIKILCDQSEERGRFWLTGSQSKRLLREAGDSLAGRLCVLHMYSLSQAEIAGIPSAPALDYSFDALRERAVLFPQRDIVDVYEHIWRGGMPDLQGMNVEQAAVYWNSYIETYLMRDAVDDNGITDTVGFRKFLRACAAFAGQMLNCSDLAAAADVSSHTAKEWLHVLQTMGIVYLLEPYYENELKRLVKTPKLYFCDTGLCAYLSSWTSTDTLMNGAAAGHYYENYVVGELVRGYAYGAQTVNLNYYRDSNSKEIDLLIEQDGVIHPLEIKKAAHPGKEALRSFSVLQRLSKPIGHGGVICMTEEPFPIDENHCYIPATIL